MTVCDDTLDIRREAMEVLLPTFTSTSFTDLQRRETLNEKKRKHLCAVVRFLTDGGCPQCRYGRKCSKKSISGKDLGSANKA